MEREELRKRLRQKIKEKQSGGSIIQHAKQDPKGLLMSMGVYDANILNAADKAVKTKNMNELKTVLETSMENEEAPPLDA